MAKKTVRDKLRLPGFYKLPVSGRLRLLKERALISEEDYSLLSEGRQVMSVLDADKMIENVLGVFSLPMGLGLNFLVNQKEYLVPLVVEEPSIVAALSSAAKLARTGGGFEAESTEPILIGQVQVVDVPYLSKARQSLLQNKDEILNLANSLHPRLVARGGGARDIEVIIHPAASQRGDMLILHLLVDTRDAMGANLVNSMCEGVASLVEKFTGGKVFLRILSNLTDRSMVRAKVRIPLESLEANGYSGERVRDGIILANDFALVDPYRATTHNKGIMNGIDPVAIATGNDWRAIEAAAHAWAGRGHSYTALTQWGSDENGDLVGSIKLPLKVGIVGGSLQSNHAVGLAHRLLNIETARELAQVMAAVGLAQNFSALKALATDGIQRGHMTLHARSVAMAAGAPPEHFDMVLKRLVESGEIKIWKAEEILKEIEGENGKESTATGADEWSFGYGKIILLGEHAVVHGSHAVAAPVPLAIQARIKDRESGGVHLVIPKWGVEESLSSGRNRPDSMQESLGRILQELDLLEKHMLIEVRPNIPRAMGLGGSAALAVAIVRALDRHYKLELSDERVNELAFASEEVAHGKASGIDNTMATYGAPMVFQRATEVEMRHLKFKQPLTLVIGISGIESLTAKMVATVAEARERNPVLHEEIFRQIDKIALSAVEAIEEGDLKQLGELMNINQGLLNALQVSTPELEEMIQIARHAGALGAKLTGGGGGGSIVALCPANAETVAEALKNAGYQSFISEVSAKEAM